MGAKNLESGEMGIETLKYNVMTNVVDQNYDTAVSEIRAFYAAKSDHPKFKPKIKRYIDHCVDLINAIRAKRNFPGISSLTMAKQQELTEKVKQHFDELQKCIKKIEEVQIQLKREDFRSTVWVVRAAMNAILLIVLVGLFVDLFRGGLLKTIFVVSDDLMGELSNWIFGLFNF